MAKSIENINEFDVNPLNASRFPDFSGDDMTAKVENGKKWMQAQIDALNNAKKQVESQAELLKQEEKNKKDKEKFQELIEQILK